MKFDGSVLSSFLHFFVAKGCVSNRKTPRELDGESNRIVGERRSTWSLASLSLSSSNLKRTFSFEAVSKLFRSSIHVLVGIGFHAWENKRSGRASERDNGKEMRAKRVLITWNVWLIPRDKVYRFSPFPKISHLLRLSFFSSRAPGMISNSDLPLPTALMVTRTRKKRTTVPRYFNRVHFHDVPFSSRNVDN